ncbi:MarR family winged helix-turn-helix transcriptional regulator [Thermohalobacter berrensis]|uniref:MarR family transcriptional regulator n=1 Tax=Thermohalobacter berrensis TaxID=99594 RepID=A0A419SY38_9FIRM|nr:MarR family transcriptional regulator [Thermohalobacter berrensis]RKD30105.1 MarR family transcriptional regulator [Thermohalobacter berrensis]
MNNNSLEPIVESIFSILPLFKKKLIKPHKHNKAIDLSPSHLQILFLLDDLGKLPISEIGKHLFISKPNMTPLIQKLIKENLVERIRNEEDRRYIDIQITKKGKELIENHKALVAGNLKKKLANLSEEDLKELSLSLNKVKEIISKLD